MKQLIKNKWLYMILITVTFGVLFQPNVTHAESFQTKVKTAIIVDAETGKILYGKDHKNELPSASMTKMMTEYIVLDKIEQGQLSWDDTIEVSDYVYEVSANNNFSGIGLRKNVAYTVEDLYKAMAIYSDNATTIALAELVAETEGEFVKIMNETAEKMQLPAYKFVNSTGLDNASLAGNHPKGTEADDINTLSAESSALLAYHLVKDYPEVLDISSIPETEFDDQLIRNWNWMLPHKTTFLEQFYYEGIDGLKTGNTSLAGFNFTATAHQKDRRLITVVMNADSEAIRFQETAKLLDYGFNHFETVELFPSGYQLKDESVIPVAKGKEDTVDIALEEGIAELIKKGKEENYSITFTLNEDLLNDKGELVAPIKKGEIVGKAELTVDEKQDYGYILEESKNNSFNLVTTKDIEKKNWFSLILSGIGEFFVNLYHKVTDLF